MNFMVSDEFQMVYKILCTQKLPYRMDECIICTLYVAITDVLLQYLYIQLAKKDRLKQFLDCDIISDGLMTICTHSYNFFEHILFNLTFLYVNI